MKKLWPSVMLFALLFILAAWTNARAETATLTWVDNSGISTTINDEETGFQIERSLNGSGYALIATTPPDIQTFLDNTLYADNNVDNKFCYRVRAINSAGVSAYATTATPGTSDCKTIAKRALLIPAGPSGLLVQ